MNILTIWKQRNEVLHCPNIAQSSQTDCWWLESNTYSWIWHMTLLSIKLCSYAGVTIFKDKDCSFCLKRLIHCMQRVYVLYVCACVHHTVCIIHPPSNPDLLTDTWQLLQPCRTHSLETIPKFNATRRMMTKSITAIHEHAEQNRPLIPPWREFASDKVTQPKAKVNCMLGLSCCKLTATKAGRLAGR